MTTGAVGNGHDMRDRPVGELLKQLSEETSTLVRQELDLAKAEISQKGRQAGAGAGMFGGAAALALFAGGALTACIIAALDTAMPLWLAALIVAVVLGAGAALVASLGRERIKQAVPPVPETQQTVKEDVEWAKTRARSART